MSDASIKTNHLTNFSVMGLSSIWRRCTQVTTNTQVAWNVFPFGSDAPVLLRKTSDVTFSRTRHRFVQCRCDKTLLKVHQ